MLGVGIIGCGTIARLRHAPEYARNADCRLIALADAVPGRAAQLAAKHEKMKQIAKYSRKNRQ